MVGFGQSGLEPFLAFVLLLLAGVVLLLVDGGVLRASVR